MGGALSYFVLGSMFTLGALCPGKWPLLRVISSISLLVFICSTSTQKDIVGTKMINKNDLIMLISGLVLEHFLVSTSAEYLKMRFLKILAACGLSVSITLFYILLDYTSRNSTGENNVLMNGPYRYVRHPIYTSLIVYWFSCCIYLSCFVSTGVLLWFVNSKLCPRVKKHEKGVLNTSVDYSEYMRTVWSGIPMYK